MGLTSEIREKLEDKDLPDDLDSYVKYVIDLDNRLEKDRSFAFNNQMNHSSRRNNDKWGSF